MIPTFKRSILTATVWGIVASNAFAAPHVEFASGQASIVSKDGHERAARRGAELAAGDTIRTLDRALVQIRLADGTFVSLQSKTALVIRDGTTFSLSAGAMRLVLADARRGDARDIRVETPAGKVNVAGSGIVEAKADGSTLIAGTSGEWRLSNSAGSLSVPAGRPAQAPARNRPPSMCDSGPSLPPPQQAFAAGRAVAPLPTSGYVQLDATGQDFDANGQPTRLVANLGTASDTYTRQPGAQVLEAGRDQYIAWGRWIGPVSLSGSDFDNYNFPADQGIHYVVGAPTAVLPTSGTATYSLLGATRPTWGSLNPPGGGDRSPGTFSGSIAVNFAPALASIGVNFLVQMPTGSYAMNGATTASSASFFLSPTVTGTGGACAIGCSAGVNGFFAGDAAQRIGVSYQITDKDVPVGAQYPTIQGSAAFKRN